MNVKVINSKTNYTFHWPAGTEEYETLLEVQASGLSNIGPLDLYIAYGYRQTFGRKRRRILVFRNEANVLAEFVGIDDWTQSKKVVSFLRRDGSKKYLRENDPVPSRYNQFNITELDAIITGPYSPRCFVALVDEEDVAALVAVAIAREEGKAAGTVGWPAYSETAIKIGAVQVDNQFGNRETVRQALFDYRATQKSGGPFTKNAEADELLRQNHFAFLMAASIDRGALAESLWEIPHTLKKKLGHLDPKVLSQFTIDQMETLLRSLGKKPRYPRQAAQTIISLSKLVIDEFQEDVSSIWHGKQPLQVTQTLEKIWGVGPGIAHMVVRILVDEYNYDPGKEGLRQIDVKPDVQVRRVFYRTGIAQDRNENTSVQVARQLHPEFPGLLDWPAWEIGRTWCREGDPNCNECPLRGACLKRDTNKR